MARGVDRDPVWSAKPNDVWVDRANTWMFHWDGSGWSRSDFNGVGVVIGAFASTSPTDAWALGHYQFAGTAFAHWNGKTWTLLADPRLGRLELFGAFALSPSNVCALAVNLDVFDTRMLHYDGSSWTVAATMPGYGGSGGVWAPDNVWATLPQGGLWHYDGTSWSSISLDTITSVTGTTAGDLLASGSDLYHHAP